MLWFCLSKLIKIRVEGLLMINFIKHFLEFFIFIILRICKGLWAVGGINKHNEMLAKRKSKLLSIWTQDI